MSKKPTKAQYLDFKKKANDKDKSESYRAKFKGVVDQWASEFEGAVKKGETEVKTAIKKIASPKKTPKKKAITKSDILKKVGKTEEECEDILDQYKALRKTSQTRKKAETKAKDDNKKRVEKLKKDDKVIKGTSTKKASSDLETTAKKVTTKLEKEVEKVEKATEKKVKADVTKKVKTEVAKDTTKTETQKKAEVKAQVEKQVEEAVKKEVAKEGKKLVAKLEADTKDIITNITTALGKMSKDLQKEYLIKLRSDIDKMLTKFMYGGLTDGAVANMNVTQSQMSAESVNPQMYANGGEIKNTFAVEKDGKYYDYYDEKWYEDYGEQSLFDEDWAKELAESKGGNVINTDTFAKGGSISEKKEEFLSNLGDKLDIDILYMVDIDEVNSFDELTDAISDNNGFDQEVIYYSTAMEYLREQDTSLSESLGLAGDMGYTTDNLNSEILASILKSERVREDYYEYQTEIEEFFDELEDEEEEEFDKGGKTKKKKEKKLWIDTGKKRRN